VRLISITRCLAIEDTLTLTLSQRERGPDLCVLWFLTRR
jgi:hypothetical protein